MTTLDITSELTAYLNHIPIDDFDSVDEYREELEYSVRDYFSSIHLNPFNSAYPRICADAYYNSTYYA